mgnify:CR=1 FL=1
MKYILDFNNFSLNEETIVDYSKMHKAFKEKYPSINYGGCAVFAKAFKNITGYPVVLIFDTDLTDNLTVSTLGGDITANVTGGATLTDTNGRVSDIIATNVQANNGIIHAINKVILP